MSSLVKSNDTSCTVDGSIDCLNSIFPSLSLLRHGDLAGRLARASGRLTYTLILSENGTNRADSRESDAGSESAGGSTSHPSAIAIFATVFIVTFDLGPSILQSDGCATPMASASSLRVMPFSSRTCDTWAENCAAMSNASVSGVS